MEQVPVPATQADLPKDETVAGNREHVMKTLEKAFADLTPVDDLKELLDLHSRMRVVVSVNKLMELKGSHCSHVSSSSVCGVTIQYSATHIGARVDLQWKCANNHCGKWESTEVLTTNSLMEHATKVVVDLEVIDKRETSGNSTVMEREGLRRLLERLMCELPLNELCTDASATIIKLVRDMKDKFPLLAEMFHSLDVWHKAKKLTKALHQAARVRGCEELKEWIDPVVNHFWYCCQMAEGSVEDLKNAWQGVLHHVCGEHVWAKSCCNHGPHVEEETLRKPLRKSSKAMAALRKIVLDQKWLKNLHFYVHFRHTGELENFNSMMTKYAPKRMAFEYPYFITRILLAAIDHNFHLFRKPKQSPGGELVGHRKYSKRTQQYHAEVVKEEKAYAYFPYIVARMLETRKGFEGSFSARHDVDEFNPKQIAPTLAMKVPPSTEELMKAPSRFAMKPKVAENLQD